MAAFPCNCNCLGYLDYTVKCFTNNENRSDIVNLIKKLDLGISEIQVEQEDFTVDSLPDEIPDELKKVLHLFWWQNKTSC